MDDLFMGGIMKKAKYIHIIALTVMFFLSAINSFSQNGTPGNKSGADNSAFLFSPLRYQADRGEDNFLLHVGDIDSLYGQRYYASVRIEYLAPDTWYPTQRVGLNRIHLRFKTFHIILL
jgi:hypothetical protein